MKKKILTGFIIVLFLGLTGAARANLITNGDFSLSVPNNGTGNGWTAANNDSLGGWQTNGGNPSGTFILNSNGASNTDPSISQSVSGLIVGTTYRLSGDYAYVLWGGKKGPNSFAVDINSNTYTFDYLGDSWHSFLIDFEADSSTITINLRAEINGDDTPYKVDNINLTSMPTPIPGAIWLLGSGFVGLIGLKRKKRISI